VTNVAFSWLEVPYEIETRVRNGHSGSPFDIVSHTFDVAFGAIGGTFSTAERAVGGAVEVGLSPFPPYDPLMSPALPPYLAAAGEEHKHHRENHEHESGEVRVDEDDGVYTQTITQEMPFKSGAVRVTGIDGTIEIRTSNGKVHCEKTDGDITARTSNGMVLLEDVEGTVDAHTSNGEIRLTMARPAPSCVDRRTPLRHTFPS
jgi:hypothetical protein